MRAVLDRADAHWKDEDDGTTTASLETAAACALLTDSHTATAAREMVRHVSVSSRLLLSQ